MVSILASVVRHAAIEFVHVDEVLESLSHGVLILLGCLAIVFLSRNHLHRFFSLLSSAM